MPITMKFGMEENTIGPHLLAKFAPDRGWTAGTGAPKIETFGKICGFRQFSGTCLFFPFPIPSFFPFSLSISPLSRPSFPCPFSSSCLFPLSSPFPSFPPAFSFPSLPFPLASISCPFPSHIVVLLCAAPVPTRSQCSTSDV